ncbi:hypothetical protein B0H21DRAFT_700744 [Amylocystis lapponica]|nr:hypothetical protein B0H21DRAFT_700744 [Amylocystis lapponica]
MSFSTPLPHKSARTPLRRTGSYLSLSDMQAAIETPLYGCSAVSPPVPDCSTSVPYIRSLRHYKEQRERRKAALSRCSSTIFHDTFTIAPVAHKFTRKTVSRPRSSSPLAPLRSPLPERACFPRSKPEPDLYRVAITTRMRMSPEGRKILHMGPHLALSMLTATRELERIVAAQQREPDGDVTMRSGEGLLSNSWVVVPPEDWEMVDCGS